MRGKGKETVTEAEGKDAATEEEVKGVVGTVGMGVGVTEAAMDAAEVTMKGKGVAEAGTRVAVTAEMGVGVMGAGRKGLGTVVGGWVVRRYVAEGSGMETRPPHTNKCHSQSRHFQHTPQC